MKKFFSDLSHQLSPKKNTENIASNSNPDRVHLIRFAENLKSSSEKIHINDYSVDNHQEVYTALSTKDS